MHPEPGFGRWSCEWYSPVDEVSVRIRYDQHATPESLQAERSQLGDHVGFVEADTDTSCTVRMLHEPGGTQQGTMDLTVRGDSGDENYCATAQDLALAAAVHLPR
jgi:eukaryotic-like serine/threonine-protein kinase